MIERGEKARELEETAIESVKIARKAIRESFGEQFGGMFYPEEILATGSLAAEVLKQLTGPSESKK